MDKYELHLNDRVLYMEETKNKKNQYDWVIKDNIRPKNTTLPCTILLVSNYNEYPDTGKSYYQSYNQGSRWLIESIKKYGKKVL